MTTEKNSIVQDSVICSDFPLFNLGSVVATHGAIDLLKQHKVDAEPMLWRHQHGDFGTVCLEDVQANLEAIKYGSRVLSAYLVGDQQMWIITEADRSSTTFLLPSEY